MESVISVIEWQDISETSAGNKILSNRETAAPESPKAETSPRDSASVKSRPTSPRGTYADDRGCEGPGSEGPAADDGLVGAP